MKKAIFTTIVMMLVLVTLVGCSNIENMVSKLDKYYYTKIISDGEENYYKDGEGNQYKRYRYNQKMYNKNGDERVEEMNESREEPLRIGAYLKVKIKEDKGVVSWEEVNKDDVPEDIIKKLDEE